MRNGFRNIRFRTKIVLLFTAILLIDTLFISILYYSYANRDTLNNYKASSEDMIVQINLHLSEKLNALTQKVSAMNSNLLFAAPMKTFLNNEGSGTDAVLAGNVADMIAELKMGDEMISSVYICTPKGIFDDFMLLKNPGSKFADTAVYQYFAENPDSRLAWLPAMENPMYLESGKIIPAAYRQRLGTQEICFVINISQQRLKEYLEQVNTFGRIFIVDRENREIVNFEEGDEELLKFFDEENEKTGEAACRELMGHGCLFTYSEVKSCGWKICAITPVSSLTKNIQSLRIFIIILVFVSLAFGFFFVLLLTNHLTRPLEQLAEVMENTVNKQFHVEFNYPYHDEIGSLGKSYQAMIEETEELISDLNIHIEALKEEKENVKWVQKQKRKAELLALQAQINPHFLYNTLNAITWQAIDQGADEIGEISSALGKYFRISLSKGREVITIREELGHVESYLEIQKFRYKSKLHYEILVEEEFMEAFVIKLVLQPLVENALYHGLKPKESGGMITITAVRIGKEGKDIQFTVSDDGCGIPEDKLQLLNNRLEAGIVDSGSGYGIYNVNERIRLYYGESYGLRLESEEGQGTRSVLLLPFDRKGDKEEDV